MRKCNRKTLVFSSVLVVRWCFVICFKNKKLLIHLYKYGDNINRYSYRLKWLILKSLHFCLDYWYKSVTNTFTFMCVTTARLTSYMKYDQEMKYGHVDRITESMKLSVIQSTWPKLVVAHSEVIQHRFILSIQLSFQTPKVFSGKLA